MIRPTYLLRTLGAIGLALILSWSLLSFAGSSLVQAQDEPTPRPSPTAGAYITISPGEAVGQQSVSISVTGSFWIGSSGVRIYWDQADGAHLLAGPVGVDGNGGFAVTVIVPADWAVPGTHLILAASDDGRSSGASILLIAPTPTDTPTPTNTPSPTATATPITPSPTFTLTPTPTPTPALVPLTPIVTASPVPPPASKPTRQPIPTLIPTHTPTPVPASPTPTATPIVAQAITTTTPFAPLPVDTATSTPTATPTATPTSTPTATFTSTPTPTSTSTPTPVVDTVNAVGAAPPSGSSGLPDLEAGMSESGDGWQATFLTGFVVAILVVVLVIAFLTVVLATVLFAWQRYHRRQLAQEQ